MTFVAAALLAFALYLWPQVRYFDLPKTNRRALTAWSNLSGVYLSLLKNDLGRWEADVEAISRLRARTGNGDEQWPNLREDLLRGIQTIELSQRDLADIAKCTPKGISFGDYQRKVLLSEKVPSVQSTNIITRQTAELLWVGAKANGSRSLRRQALSGLAYAAVGLAQVIETFSHSLSAAERLPEIEPRTPTLQIGTAPLANQHVVDGFEVARKIIERRKRTESALEDLLLLTYRLRSSLSGGSVSNEDMREMEDRLRAFGISLE